MKKKDVKIGGVYIAKVSDRLTTVRIDSANRAGGWNATNTATGKRIRVKTAQRLRGPAGDRRDHARAVADADQENARVRDERAAARDGQTASERAMAATDKRMSAITAAYEALARAERPLNCKEMIEMMSVRGLWKSPGGKTPEATLYSAIIREIAAKGDAARFRKTARGQFAANPGAAS